MAPSKVSKRVASSNAGAASPKKRGKIAKDEEPTHKDPLEETFASIVTTLEEADDLNEHCRQMLIGMLRPSLAKAKSERHDVQSLGVSMIEEALQAHKMKLAAAVEVAQQKIDALESSKQPLLQNVDDAKALVVDRETVKNTASAAHEVAQSSTKAAEEALSEARSLQEQSETTHTVLEKERVAIDAAYKEHFKAPMDNDQGPNHILLKPFIETLGLEESLISALPSSCVKTKEQRGGFDDLVLTELGKALVVKIGQYEKSVADAALAISEMREGVASAEGAVADRRQAEKTAAENLETATAALKEAQAKLAKASQEWTAFEPQVNEAGDNYNLQESKRLVFEDGPLKSFEALREKDLPTLVDAEASNAGA